MIKNERQYRITKAQAGKFSEALAQLTAASRPTDSAGPLLAKAQMDALGSQLEELQGEISEYEGLRSGEYEVLRVASFAELPRALIQARIATGLSQSQLAGRMGVAEQQIQQYEATDYASASFTRVREVIDALGVSVREEVVLPKSGGDEAAMQVG